MKVSLTDPAARLVDPALPAADRPAASGGVRASFAELLNGLGREMNRGEARMRDALGAMHGGGEMGPERLIALQAGVYRYSEAVDLTSRLVDRITGGVKTIVQGGGQ